MIRYRYNARQALTKILTEIEEVEDSDSGLLDSESEDDSVEFADANENSSEHEAVSQTDNLPSATLMLSG